MNPQPIDVPAEPATQWQPEPALPPGPRMPRVVQTWFFMRRPFDLLERCVRRFGDAFTVRLLGMPPGVVLSDPEAIRDLLAADGEAVVAGESNAGLLEPILGRASLLLLDGARHLRERRLMLPPFHGERMHVYGEIMREITRQTMATWPVGRPFPIQREMQRITLEVILRAVFGIDDDDQRGRLRAAILRFLELIDGPAAATVAVPAAQVELWGLAPWGRFVRRKRAVGAEILATIAHRRAAGTAGRDDVLSMLLDARDAELHGEMKVVVAEVLARADLRVAAGYRPRIVRRAVTLAASGGVPVVLDRHAARAT